MPEDIVVAQTTSADAATAAASEAAAKRAMLSAPNETTVVDPVQPVAAQTATTTATAPAAITLAVTPPPAKTAEEVAAQAAADAEAKKRGEAVTYAKTGDSSLDAALEFVGKLGLLPDNPALVAAGAGNFDLLRAYFAQSPVTGWETMVKIGEDGFKRFLASNAQKVLDERAVGIELAGSEENLNEAVAWANAEADPDEKTAFNEMMSKGGFMARAALSYVVNAHQASKDTVVPVSAVNPAKVTKRSEVSGGPLNRVQFAEEARKLYRAQGDQYINSPEYAALGRRLVR